MFWSLTAWTVLFAAAVWGLTARERRAGRRPRWRALRWALRACSLGPPASAAAAGYEEFVRRGVLPLSLSTWLGLLIVPCWLLLFVYLRRVADSVLDPRLAEHCRIVLWGMGLSLGAYVAMILSEEFGVHLFTDGRGISMLLVLALLVSVLLFLLWSCHLLYRFSAALTLAARAARRSWAAADAAATPPS